MAAIHCRAPFCVEEVATIHDVCDVCWAWRTVMLTGMPLMWVRVHRALAPTGSTVLRERVSVSAPGGSVPLRDGPLWAMSYALAVMEVWADTFLRRGAPGVLPERGKAREGFIFGRAVELCVNNDHELYGGPMAGDYYSDVHKAYWALARVDNTRLDTVRVRRPCPACRRKTLIERHAGECLQCLTCSRQFNQAALAKEMRNAW